MKVIRPTSSEFWDYMQKEASTSNVYCLHYYEGTSLFTNKINEYTWQSMESIDIVNLNTKILVPSEVSLV